MDRGAWRAAVHGVAEGWTRLGTGLDDGRVKGRVGAKETREEEPASQRDPHTAQAKGLTLDLVGTQLVSAP